MTQDSGDMVRKKNKTERSPYIGSKNKATRRRWEEQ